LAPLLHIIPLRYSAVTLPPPPGSFFFKAKVKKEHDRRSDGKDHEGIYVRQAAACAWTASIDSGVRLHLRIMSAQSGVGQALAKAVNRVLQIGASGADVIAQNLLMELRAPRD
jgi:hypothetical protein